MKQDSKIFQVQLAAPGATFQIRLGFCKLVRQPASSLPRGRVDLAVQLGCLDFGRVKLCSSLLGPPFVLEPLPKLPWKCTSCINGKAKLWASDSKAAPPTAAAYAAISQCSCAHFAFPLREANKNGCNSPVGRVSRWTLAARLLAEPYCKQRPNWQATWHACRGAYIAWRDASQTWAWHALGQTTGERGLSSARLWLLLRVLLRMLRRVWALCLPRHLWRLGHHLRLPNHPAKNHMTLALMRQMWRTHDNPCTAAALALPSSCGWATVSPQHRDLQKKHGSLTMRIHKYLQLICVACASNWGSGPAFQAESARGADRGSNPCRRAYRTKGLRTEWPARLRAT